MAGRHKIARIFIVCRSMFDRISNPRALRSDYGGKIFVRNTCPCRLLKKSRAVPGTRCARIFFVRVSGSAGPPVNEPFWPAPEFVQFEPPRSRVINDDPEGLVCGVLCEKRFEF
jgi:hypothetical protein